MPRFLDESGVIASIPAREHRVFNQGLDMKKAYHVSLSFLWIPGPEIGRGSS